MTTLNRFSTFQTTNTLDGAVTQNLGLTALIAQMAAMTAPLVVQAQGAGRPNPSMPNVAYDDDWAVWYCTKGKWWFGMIGGTSVDDALIELLDHLSSPEGLDARDVWIAPPGGLRPRLSS